MTRLLICLFLSIAVVPFLCFLGVRHFLSLSQVKRGWILYACLSFVMIILYMILNNFADAETTAVWTGAYGDLAENIDYPLLVFAFFSPIFLFCCELCRKSSLTRRIIIVFLLIAFWVWHYLFKNSRPFDMQTEGIPNDPPILKGFYDDLTRGV